MLTDLEAVFRSLKSELGLRPIFHHKTNRVTVELKRADGRTLYIRKITRAEPRQQRIYDALGITDRPGQTEETVI